MTDDLSERILDAAYRLIAKHGLRRTSIADIVKESGVSKATLFRRFPNRAALLHALMVAKPSTAKGQYLQSITLTSTMGLGVKVDPSQKFE